MYRYEALDNAKINISNGVMCIGMSYYETTKHRPKYMTTPYNSNKNYMYTLIVHMCQSLATYAYGRQLSTVLKYEL